MVVRPVAQARDLHLLVHAVDRALLEQPWQWAVEEDWPVVVSERYVRHREGVVEPNASDITELVVLELAVGRDVMPRRRIAHAVGRRDRDIDRAVGVLVPARARCLPVVVQIAKPPRAAE